MPSRVAASRSTGSRRRPDAKPAVDAARSSMIDRQRRRDRRAARRGAREEQPARVDEEAPVADLPDEDRPALLDRDPTRVRQADRDLGAPSDGGSAREPRLERLGGEAEEVRARPASCEPARGPRPSSVSADALDARGRANAERRRRGERRRSPRRRGEHRRGPPPARTGVSPADARRIGGRAAARPAERRPGGVGARHRRPPSVIAAGRPATAGRGRGRRAARARGRRPARRRRRSRAAGRPASSGTG